MTQRSRNATADPFTSVFRALRTSLTAQVSQAQHNATHDTSHVATAPVPLNMWPRGSSISGRSSCSLSAPDAFLGLLAQSDPNVRAALLSDQTQQPGGASSYSTVRIQELRRRRKRAQKRRQAHIQELQQQHQAIACDCDHVVRQAQVNAARYTQFARQSYERSSQRLQTLLFECIAEMKKALERIDGMAIESTGKSESMAHERAKQFEWDVFLARLQHDLNGAIGFSQLYPLQKSSGDGGASTSAEPSARINSSSGTRVTSSNSSETGTDLKATMRDLLIRNGPVLESGQTLQIQRVIAVLPSRNSTSSQLAGATDAVNTSKGKPSLHFGDCGSSAWLKIARSTIQAATPPLAPLSRRSHRRLPPSRGCASVTMFFSTSATRGGETSEIRQFTTKTTLQFPKTECDVPLSSTCITWLLASDPQHSCGGSSWTQTIDSNVYLDLEEYEVKLTKAMGGENVLASTTDTHFVTDKAIFASARRALHEVNLILEHARKTSSSSPPQTHQILFARRAETCTDLSNCNGQQQQRRESVFVRASVLQLLQTAYYSEHFLRKMSPSDAVLLEQLYPVSLFGAGILSSLYVPYFDVDANANPSTEPEVVVPTSSTRAIVMEPLEKKAIHELLLVYVARGRQESTDSGLKDSNRLVSLAISDSISTLFPALHEQNSTNDDKQDESAASTALSSVHQCTIKHPGSLWKQGRVVKRTPTSLSESTEAQVISSAEYLYVEHFVPSQQYQVLQASHQELQERDKSSSVTDLQTQIQEIFGRGCYWRSCLLPAQAIPQSSSTSKQSLCAWHGVLKQFLSTDEAEQYLLSPSELKSCVASLGSGSRADAVKRVIQKSSSLLDELTSRQLATSIGSFFEHVKLSFSNQAFESQALDGKESHDNAHLDLALMETQNQQTVDDLEAVSEELEQIRTLERSCSKEFQRLIQLTVYPGVDTSVIRKACVEIKEFDADIRTEDLELMLRLSSRKLQLIRRRREDVEACVTLRLAQSNSTSTISAYSAASSISYASHTTTQDFSMATSSSPVYDVVHVLRKGRKSLMQQQQRLSQKQKQNQVGFRPQSAGSSNSTTGLIDKSTLSQSVSEILHQAQQFELKHPVKRGSGGVVPTGKKPSAKPYKR